MNARLCSLLLALLFAACHRAAVPTREGPGDSLDGVVLPIEGGPTLRWVVAGSAGGVDAEVELDLAAPLTLVTGSCFTEAPRSNRKVRVTRLSGKVDTLSEVTLPETTIGGRRIAPRPAGLVTGLECKVVLGTDVLGPYAFRFDPERWELSIRHSEGRPSKGEGVLQLSRDPLTDRLLIPARLRGPAGGELVAGFILSTTTPRSFLSEAAASSGRLETDRALATRLDLPQSVLRPLQGVSTYSLETLQLAPGLEVRRALLEGTNEWSQAAAVGVLGPDIWGRFEATVDVPAQTLTLRRPQLSGEVRRRTCGPTDSQEACFALAVAPAPDDEAGIRATATVWRDLPTGGRVYIEPLDGDGKPVRAPCRIGFNVPPGDRGRSVTQVFPWPELTRAFPGCAEALEAAEDATLLLFEEGGDPQCAGTCAMAIHPRGRAMVCSCASAPGERNPNVTERTLQLFRRLRDQELARQRPAAEVEEPEPVD